MFKVFVRYTRSMSKTKPEDTVSDTSVLYRLTLVAAVVQPLMTVPQAVQVFTTHDAQLVAYYMAGLYNRWLGVSSLQCKVPVNTDYYSAISLVYSAVQRGGRYYHLAIM